MKEQRCGLLDLPSEDEADEAGRSVLVIDCETIAKSANNDAKMVSVSKSSFRRPGATLMRSLPARRSPRASATFPNSASLPASRT